MPTAQELKKAREALDTQIAAAEQEWEAKEARLRAEEWLLKRPAWRRSEMQWGGISMRQGGLLRRRLLDDNFCGCHRSLEEVRRGRKGWKVHL